jgi:hypothetical protein
MEDNGANGDNAEKKKFNSSRRVYKASTAIEADQERLARILETYRKARLQVSLKSDRDKYLHTDVEYEGGTRVTLHNPVDNTTHPVELSDVAEVLF